ncbi:MAG: flippase-like domain-containing protein [Bacteroides sp.]|nr:flippase-like domain-containing protein [Bacillota bacterium]MCM1393571.1 flippase-like domain-containing protein [[Eubacterium] siraeum]MCM1455010.1 flippase-like domain-containing protein [Bacteroides sp.]
MEILTNDPKASAKSSKTKRIFKTLLLLLFFGATFYTVYAVSKTLSGGSIASFYDVISSINPVFAVALVLVVVGLVLSDALKYSVLSKITSGRFDFALSLRVGIMGRFYDNITPFNTGGQAYQIYQYCKAEYPSTVAAAIPIIKYIFQLIAWIVVSVILYIVNHAALDYLPDAQATAVGTLTYVGIAIAAAAPTLVILFSLFPKPVEKVIGFFLKIGVKLKIVKEYDKAYGKASAFLDGYKQAFKHLAKNFVGILSLFLICCADFLLVMSVPFFVVLALGNSTPTPKLFFDVITLNAYSLFAASLVPTPGNSGAIEGVASMAFAPIPMASGALFWLVFIWRFCTYYIYIILGLFGTLYKFLSSRVKKRRQKVLESESELDGARKIRVLQVLDNYFPIIDGVVNVVDNYARILNERFGDELSCDALVPRYPPPYKNDVGYKVIRTLSMSGGKYGVRLPLPQLDLKLKKYLRENRYDLVHCHSPVTLSKTALKYCKRNGIPIVFTVHTKYHEEINRSVKLKPLQKFALGFLLSSIRKMDYIWACSEHCKEVLKDVYKIDRPCDVVPNGTDLFNADSERINERAAEIAAAIKRTDDERLFLFVGRLVVVKNISLILKTFACLREKGIQARLVLVGDGDYKERLIKEADELGISDYCEFVGRVTDRAELAAYYKAADYFLFPSTFDNASLTVREAEAMGTPCVVVENSSSSEGIVDCENGFTAENSPDAWADKIEFIENNREIYLRVSERCSKNVQSWDEVMDIVWSKYKEIIRLSRTPQ